MGYFAGRMKQMIELLEQESDDPQILDRVLERSHLTRAYLTPDGPMPTPVQRATFLRECCDAMADNTFAARAGLTFRDSTTLTAYISKYSRNLQSAIENSAKYFATVDSTLRYSLRVSGNTASFEVEWLDPTLAKFHRYNEYILFAALSRMRTLTDTPFLPVELRFVHQVKSVQRQMQRVGNFPVIFGAERMEMILPLSALELPIPTYDPSLKEHLIQYAERLMKDLITDEPTLRARIEGTLANNLPGRVLSADEVAANLGMSRRTFARRLKGEGQSYREIVDDLRCDLAKTYLKGGFSISQVAFFLDYADQAAFSTAFKRWTGENPSRFKASSLH
ncbi:MAG: helix-turn-helix domain-containing protein [Rhodobacteraceae bacterium]|nr:helix-turn-helix domain-containing protein [Paracoccaceae bacterium]